MLNFNHRFFPSSPFLISHLPLPNPFSRSYVWAAGCARPSRHSNMLVKNDLSSTGAAVTSPSSPSTSASSDDSLSSNSNELEGRRTTERKNLLGTPPGGSASSARWSEPGCVIGEPILIPRPAPGVAFGQDGPSGSYAAAEAQSTTGGLSALDEDDGVILVAVNRKDGQSCLQIHDAKTLQLECRLGLPTPLPYGFHGLFVPSPS